MLQDDIVQNLISAAGGAFGGIGLLGGIAKIVSVYRTQKTADDVVDIKAAEVESDHALATADQRWEQTKDWIAIQQDANEKLHKRLDESEQRHKKKQGETDLIIVNLKAAHATETAKLLARIDVLEKALKDTAKKFEVTITWVKKELEAERKQVVKLKNDNKRLQTEWFT